MGTQYVYGKWGGISGWDQFTLPIHDFRHKRIWNKDTQFPDLCLTLGGTTTGIQIRRHVIIYRISIGLPLGTSNTDTWRLKPSTRCQLLVDRSELCTNVIFNFSQLILEKRKKEKEEKTLRTPNGIVFSSVPAPSDHVSFLFRLVPVFTVFFFATMLQCFPP